MVNPRWSLGAGVVSLLFFLAVLLALRGYVPGGPRRAGQPSTGRARITAVTAERTPSPGARPRTPLPPLRRPHVVVEKSARRLTLYDGDRAVRSYRAAVGSGKGDKVREGDRRTPEGEFIVCVKNPRSRFTRALGLSYPNIKDARRGLRDGLITRRQHDAIVAAVRQGRRPPWKTPLGGEIMIHGGGAGRNWTDGCIALEDADILELYRALPVGTPVTILP
jgi:lipoprotein-anchoring transpeptidase ErfK/SrfK